MGWRGTALPQWGEIKQVRALKEAGCMQYQGVGLGRIYLKVLEKLASVIVGSVYGRNIFKLDFFFSSKASVKKKMEQAGEQL